MAILVGWIHRNGGAIEVVVDLDSGAMRAVRDSEAIDPWPVRPLPKEELVVADGDSFSMRVHLPKDAPRFYVLTTPEYEVRLPSNPEAEAGDVIHDDANQYIGVERMPAEIGFEVVELATGTLTSIEFCGRILWGAGTDSYFATDLETSVSSIRSLSSSDEVVIEKLDPDFHPERFIPNSSLNDVAESALLAPGAIDDYFSELDDAARSRLPQRSMSRDVEVLPSVRLVPVSESSSRTRIGGEPDLPPDVDWPTINDVALPFVAQIDLAEISAVAPVEHFPCEGLVSFFYYPNIDSYEELLSPETIDSVLDAGADEGWHAMLLSAEAKLERRQLPDAIPAPARFAETLVELRAEDTRQTLDFDINDPDRPEPPSGYQHWRQRKEAYESTLIPGPLHRFGGHADYVQPSECGDLILQIGMTPGQEFGDGGQLLIYAERLDQLASDFSNVIFYEASH